MADFPGYTVRTGKAISGSLARPTYAGFVPQQVTFTVVTYQNRVFDTTINNFVTWNSELNPNTSGSNYPGPGVFGVDTEDFTFRPL